jgi:hypothetical protein
MSGKPKSFRELIDLWPKKTFMANQLGVTRGQVDDWYRRNRIPPSYWGDIITACVRFGYELNADDMLKIHSGSGHLSPNQRMRKDERTSAG